jgi:hypothetical protein
MYGAFASETKADWQHPVDLKTIVVCLAFVADTGPVGASLLAKAQCQSALMSLTECLREQARSHIGLWWAGHFWLIQDLWERACSRKRSVSQY